MTLRAAFAASLMGLLAAGARGQDAGGTAPRITGTVTYVEKIALPPDATVRVRLDDTTEPELPGRLVADTTIPIDGKQIPIAFELTYRAADIQPTHRYSVRATISAGGKTLFSSKSPYAVITRGSPTKVEILVQQAGADRRPRAARSLSTPVTFTGVFPCADCEGVRETITLRADGTYLSRRERLGLKSGKPERSYDLGRWEIDDEKKQLVLRGGRKEPEVFAIVDAATIRLLDGQEGDATSKGNHDLHRALELDQIRDTFRMRGEFVSTTDGGWFIECLTGKRFSVSREGESAALELASKEAKIANGKPLLVTLDGRLDDRFTIEGSQHEVLIVDRFDRAWPGKRCGAIPGLASLEGTTWKLVELGGAVPRSGPGAKETTLRFDANKKSLAGSTGCNSFAGTYALSKGGLRLTPGPMTMMACPDDAMTQERAFLAALRAVTGYRIAGGRLELLAAGSVLARLDPSPEGAARSH